MIRKISYSLYANIFSSAVSFISVLFIPRFFVNDIAQYGFYQIFIFYVGYIGFFHLGWCDGFYLRDGGKEYAKLPFNLYSIQFRLLVFFESIISIFIVLYAFFFVQDTNLRFIFIMISLNVVLSIPQTMIMLILQATNRIKEYSIVTITNRMIFGFLLLLIFILRLRDFKMIILSFNISYLVSLSLSVYLCNEVVFSKAAGLSNGFREAIVNISIGSKLMLVNISNLLINGIVRIGIQNNWSVSIFGEVSFALSITNIVLLVVDAIAIALYPDMKQRSDDYLKKNYQTFSSIIMIPLFGALVFYFPMIYLIKLWLPQYVNSILYLSIIFPTFIYTAKMGLLTSTYMKVLRFEKKMLYVNLIGLVIATITTLISTIILNNLFILVLSILINLVIRSAIAETIVLNHLKLNYTKDIVSEFLLVVLFLVFSSQNISLNGLLIYLCFYILFLIMSKERVINIIKFVKSRIN